jgi:hypothetical protein
LADATVNLHSYYIPAYIYESDVGSLSKYKIINAYTGEIHANKIYSLIKSSILGASIGTVLSVGFTLMTRPYLIPVQLATHVLLGSSISAIISGTFANIYNKINNIDDKLQRENDTKFNTDYIETDDDVERRKYAATVNDKFDYVIKNNIHLPIDKLKLLQLNPDHDITLTELKNAYHTQIKRWHPDLHPDKKMIAENMTKQINIAYQELLKILLKN